LFLCTPELINGTTFNNPFKINSLFQRIHWVKLAMILFTTILFQRYCLAQKIDSIVPKNRKVFLKLFPNPVKNKANFELINFDPGIVQLQIRDQNGTVYYNEKRLIVSGKDELVVFFQLKTGNYWCIVQQKERVAKTQMLVIE
jgi:hypothetical protein